MGGALRCPRRALPEPLCEPDPDSASDEPEVATEDLGLVERAPPDAGPLAIPQLGLAVVAQGVIPELVFRIGDCIGRLGEPLNIDWEHTDIRVYTVWRISRADNPTEWAGVHWGKELCAYSVLVTLNHNEFTGLRWKRVKHIEAGVRAYRTEAVQHNVPLRPIRVYGWHWRQGN